MRRAAKVDANQAEIVAALRKIGCRVMPMHAMGGGFPDLLVSFRGLLTLIEVKDGSKPPSARQLTPAQVKWHAEWGEDVRVVKSIDEAIEAVTR
jgi:Holliday junction resolvase